MTLEQKVALWDVVNDYMRACGGRERTTGVARQNAVVLVEGVVDALLAEARREALTGVRDAIEAASRENQAKADAAQESGDLSKAAQLILWGGGIVEALLIVRNAVPK